MSSSPPGASTISACKHAVLSRITPEKVVLGPPPSRVLKVNDYLLRAKLGRGASSRVYLGVECRTGLQYAIKRVKLTELGRQTCAIAQLEREIRLMQTLHHRNIRRLKEVLLVESVREVYLVCEYGSKGCVGAFVERNQSLSHASIFSLVKQVAGAIKYLHESGFVHQDIKPWNIVIDDSGRALLADFGIGHSFSSAGMVVGSPAFQAPEALDDDVDEDLCGDGDAIAPQKEDVWALGVTLYQLLFMRLPFPGDNLYEIVNYIREHELCVGPCEPALEALLRGMLTVDPSRRFGIDDVITNPLISNAADLATDLPPVPMPEIIVGDIVQIDAVVCRPGASFARLAAKKSEKFIIKPPPIAKGTNFLTRKKASDTDSADDEPLVMSSPIAKL